MNKQKNKKVPELRFPEFEGDWEEKKLGELCKFEQGTQVPVEQQFADERFGERFIRIENYTQGSKEFRYVELDNQNINRVSKDDIVAVRYGATAGFIGRGLEGIIANNLFTIRPLEDVLILNYLYLILNSEKVFKRLQLLMFGGAMPALSFGILNSLKIPYTNNGEQKKIAGFLASVDERVELLGAKLARLREYKKGLMQKIFSGEIRFTKEDGTNYPDWQEKKLGELGKIITGKTPKTNDINLWNGDIDFVTPTDIIGSKYIDNVERKVANNTKNILPANSIVYTCIASIGKMGIIKRKSITNQQINTIIPSDEISNEFVYYSLLNKTPKIISTQANTTLPIINKTDFSKLKVKISLELAEQKKIADFLSSVDEKIDNLSKQITETKKYKKSLLQKMLI